MLQAEPKPNSAMTDLGLQRHLCSDGTVMAHEFLYRQVVSHDWRCRHSAMSIVHGLGRSIRQLPQPGFHLG